MSEWKTAVQTNIHVHAMQRTKISIMNGVIVI